MRKTSYQVYKYRCTWWWTITPVGCSANILHKALMHRIPLISLLGLTSASLNHIDMCWTSENSVHWRQNIACYIYICVCVYVCASSRFVRELEMVYSIKYIMYIVSYQYLRDVNPLLYWMVLETYPSLTLNRSYQCDLVNTSNSSNGGFEPTPLNPHPQGPPLAGTQPLLHFPPARAKYYYYWYINFSKGVNR